MRLKFYALFLLLAAFPFKDWGQSPVTLTSGTSWTVPANVYSLRIECWGGGGAGGGVNAGSRGAAGGGAGGAYARVNALTVSPGAVISYNIGAGGVASGTTGQSGAGGDTWFSSNTTVLAKGGPGALTISSVSAVTSGTGATSATGSIGDVTYRGGNGGNGAAVASGNSYSGGGGSSAGTGTDGNNGGTPTAGSAPTGGFAGAAGKDAGSTTAGAGNAATATNYGAGGGGASASASTGLRAGGNGAQGRIVITYTVVTCTTPTQSFATDPVAKSIGDAAFTNTFTTNSTGAVTYSSSATSVATVDASSGLVTIVGSGTAIITASQAADATYCAASKTYTLNVSACAAPTEPTTFSATATASTANLSWTAGNGAGRAAFLKAGSFTSAVPAAATVYTGNAAFGSGTGFDGGFAVSVGTGNSVNVTGLTANTLYNAKVFEYNNTQGNACYNTAIPLTGTLTTLSNAPTAIAASATSTSGFTANWTAPTGNGSATFTYSLLVATDTAFSNIVSTTNSIASGTTSQLIAGLNANTTYYYRVRAVNAGGNSANSNTITVITLPAAPPTPTTTANCDSTILNAYTGGQSSTYFWQGTSASGTSQTQPATANYTATTAGTYYVRAFANGQWSAATSVAVTIAKNPAITTQPSSTSVGRGNTATFTVVATNPNGYQWQENTGSGWANITNGTANGVTYSNATTTTLSIASTIVAMSGYQYRVVIGTTSPCSTSVTSNAVTLTVTPTSATTDYYRSRRNGRYDSTSTWESSMDSVSWINATAIPTSAARSITIRSTDSVNVAASGGTANRLYVYGIMTFSQSLTIANSSGYDMVIFSGARVDHNNNVTLASSAEVLTKTGGRITANSSTTLNNVGTVSSYTFEDSSILDYNATPQPGIGNTYFPSATGYPILRFSNTPVGSIGSSTPTVVNGRVEISAGATVTFSGTGKKTFAGGITNNGTLSFSSQLEITGTNAILEGSTPITIGSSGFSIASGASVRLLSNVTINTGSTGTLTISGTLNTNNFILSGSSRVNVATSSSLSVTDTAGITTSGTFGNIQTTGTRTYNKTATYIFQGSAAQVTGNGLPDSVATLIMSNAAGVTLSRATTITTALQLGTGNITTTSTNLLTLGASASISNASASSYIDGPLRRLTAAATAFSFPIGKNGVYAPAAVTPVDVTASNYTVEHFNGTQATPGRTDKDTPTLRYVSANAYYDISRGAGANARITLSYNESNKVTDLSTLVIAHYTGGRWISEGRSAGTGNTTSGTVTSGIVSTFSPFAIGATASNQPLPIRLLSFHARKQETTARLHWELGTTDGGEVIVVERSADGKVFEELNQQQVAQHTTLSQSFTDYTPLAGTNYYRLHIIGINGEESFSQTLGVRFDEIATEDLKAYPNPTRDVLTLEWTNSEAPAQIALHNSMGQLVWTERIASGNVLSIPVEKLMPGMYWITLEQAGIVQRQKVQVVR